MCKVQIIELRGKQVEVYSPWHTEDQCKKPDGPLWL